MTCRGVEGLPWPQQQRLIDCMSVVDPFPSDGDCAGKADDTCRDQRRFVDCSSAGITKESGVRICWRAQALDALDNGQCFVVVVVCFCLCLFFALFDYIGFLFFVCLFLLFVCLFVCVCVFFVLCLFVCLLLLASLLVVVVVQERCFWAFSIAACADLSSSLLLS